MAMATLNHSFPILERVAASTVFDIMRAMITLLLGALRGAFFEGLAVDLHCTSVTSLWVQCLVLLGKLRNKMKDGETVRRC